MFKSLKGRLLLLFIVMQLISCAMYIFVVRVGWEKKVLASETLKSQRTILAITSIIKKEIYGNRLILFQKVTKSAEISKANIKRLKWYFNTLKSNISELFVFNSHDKLIINLLKNKTDLKRVLASDKERLLLLKNIEKLSFSSEGVYEYKQNDSSSIKIYFSYIQELGLYVCSPLNTKAVKESILLISKDIIFISIVLLLIMVIISMFFADTISTPIFKLIDMMNEIKLTGLSKISSISIEGPKEMKEIGEIFNVMILSLNQVVIEKDIYLKDLQKKNKELEDFNRNLEVTVNERTHELLYAYKKLKELDVMKSDFLSMVSHDLRTPLVSIIGFAEIIQKSIKFDISPHISQKNEVFTFIEEMNDHIDIIISESERLTKLINNLLDLAKFESGDLDTKFEDVNIKNVIERACASTYALLENKDVELISEIPDELPKIKGNEDRLIQVMVNLISNSIKFTKEGHIECKVKIKKNKMIVTVSDTGVGIDGDNKDIFFEKFRQGKNASKIKHRGTGLGLPIAKQIIENHSGNIWVEHSFPSEGTSIAFSLPV